MASAFDTAWAPSDAALSAVMGEVITIGGKPIPDAVVSEVSAGSQYRGMTVNSGVSFTVFLSRLQLDGMLTPQQSAHEFMRKEVLRGAFKGRVMAVRDLGGAGAEFEVGPAGDR